MTDPKKNENDKAEEAGQQELTDDQVDGVVGGISGSVASVPKVPVSDGNYGSGTNGG